LLLLYFQRSFNDKFGYWRAAKTVFRPETLKMQDTAADFTLMGTSPIDLVKHSSFFRTLLELLVT